MFRVAKAPYEMEVMVKGETIRIKPLNKYISFVGRTLARCEEFLAQQFFQEHPNENKQDLMQSYFESRGWQIST